MARKIIIEGECFPIIDGKEIILLDPMFVEVR